MTIREIGIAVGFEIDKSAEAQVNSAVQALKSAAADALSAIEVVFETDKASEQAAQGSVDSIKENAEKLGDNKVGFKVDEASVKKVTDSVNKIKSFATKALGAIGIGLSLIQLKNVAEEFGGINRQIKDATRGMGEQKDIQQSILKAANDARMNYSSMGEAVSKLAQNTDVFNGVEDAANFAGLMAKNFIAAGKGEAEADALMKSITTSMTRGKVDARALMNMIKESPGTLRMMADSLGVSTDAFQDMVREGKVSAQMLKTTFEKNAGAIEGRFSETGLGVSSALRNIRNQWGLFIAQLNSDTGTTKAIGEFMVKSFSKFLNILRKLKDGFMKLANKMGGVDKLMKLIAISAGAIFLALNAGKILGFVKSVTTGIKGVATVLKGVSWQVWLIIGAIILVWLIIDDFIGFMQGKDSVIGELFKKAGIDADAVRDKIRDAVDRIVEKWEEFKEAIQPAIDKLKEIWAEHGPAIMQVFANIIASGILGFLEGLVGVLAVIAGAIEGITTLLNVDWPAAWASATAILEPVKKIISDIKEGIGAITGAVKGLLGGGSSGGGGGAWGSKTPGYAKGTNRTPDTFFAGEDGPELITGAAGRKVFTAAETGNIMSILKTIMGMGTARPETVAAATSAAENKIINQNNYFTQTFNGDRAGQQKSSEAMDRASDDATGALARALAYVR